MQPTVWSSYKRQFFPGQSNFLRKSSSRDRISTDACKREKYFVLTNVDSKVDVTFLTKGITQKLQGRHTSIQPSLTS